MNKEFVPYQESLELKELGFDKPCFGYYTGDKMHLAIRPLMLRTNELESYVVTAPTFSQAFRWFREKRSCVCEIIRKEEGNHSEFIGWVYIDDRKIDVVSYWDSKSYEEAELACLLKLIEIVKTK